MFCQIAGCSYAEKKHFQKRKHLKQHLLKVHAAKKFTCVCGKAFSTKNFLLAHERQCGKEFKCYECDWLFNSREALLTHARRKNHNFEFEKKIVPAALFKIKILPKKSSKTATDQVHQSVQTAENHPKKRKLTQTTQTTKKEVKKMKTTATETQTPVENSRTNNSSQTTKTPSMVDFFDDSLSIFPGNFDGSLCSTETQTEGRILNTHRTSRLDPLLYSHMYTQTCDEILSELGLSDVQTQTTWPPPDLQDFLVSTETQTSFTQCLEEEMASFTTTHTQT